MITLLETTVDNALKAPIAIPKKGNRTCVVQATFIGGSPTIKVYGRLSNAFGWTEIIDLSTANSAQEVVLMPEMTATAVGVVTSALVGLAF